MEEGYEQEIFRLVRKQASPAQWAEWLRTPLELAGATGNLDLVAKLVGAGANGSAVCPAARVGDLKLVRDLLDIGASLSARDAGGSAPIHHAAASGNTQITQLLLLRRGRGGGLENARDGQGRTPLHLAAERGHLAATTVLLAAGADETLRFGDGERSALDLASLHGHTDVLKVLAHRQAARDNGQDPSSSTLAPSGARGGRSSHAMQTALRAAVGGSKASAIHALVEAGARVDDSAGDEEGRTALHCAAAGCLPAAIAALLHQGADENRRDASGLTPLHLAVLSQGRPGAEDLRGEEAFEADRVSGVSALLAAGANADLRYGSNGISVLEGAASGGHVGVLRVLVCHGADPNARDSEGRGPCHRIAAGIVDAGSNAEDAVIALVEVGADINALEDCDRTPLHLALGNGEGGLQGDDLMRVVGELIWQGADVNITDIQGNTALHFAAMRRERDAVIALAHAGASVDAQDEYGQTALHAASRNGFTDVVEALLQLGADKDKVDVVGETPILMAVSVGCAPTVNALLAAGANPSLGMFSAVEAATRTWHVPTLRALVQHGADVNAVHFAGETVLHLAVEQDRVDAVEVLLQVGADVNRADDEGRTALHVAANRLRLGAALVLLDHGADVNARDENGESPLHALAFRAQESPAVELARLLLKRGADHTAVNSDHNTPADLVELLLQEVDSGDAGAKDLLALFVRAGLDKAWRRRGFFVLCRAHPERLQLGYGSRGEGDLEICATSDRPVESRVKAARVGAAPGEGCGIGGERGDSTGVARGTVSATTVDARLDGVADWLVETKEGIFRTVVGFL